MGSRPQPPESTPLTVVVVVDDDDDDNGWPHNAEQFHQAYANRSVTSETVKRRHIARTLQPHKSTRLCAGLVLCEDTFAISI